MRRFAWAGLALLAACGQAQSDGTQSFSVAEPAAAPAATPAKGAGGAEPLEVTLPRIAYHFTYSFLLPADSLAKTQAAHVALCDRMGPARCQLLDMKTTLAEDRSPAGSLTLRVASPEARRFGALATAEVGRAGGRAVDQKMEAEDVSKQMVDAAARIRQRELLVQRLTDILRTRTGKVAELVEAERSVATAQEELDAARGWLAELRGRVAYSTIDILYAARTPAAGAGGSGGLLEDVQVSLSTFLGGMRGILSLLIFVAPWLLVLGLVAWGVRQWRRRSAPPPAGD